MALDIKEEFSSIRERYSSSPKPKSNNFLVIGESGTGKTLLASTCRKPVLIHSFDPSGTSVLSEWIEEGEVLVDDRFESEDAKNPEAYKLWENAVNQYLRENFFASLGTYYLDSGTMWAEALMNQLLKQAGRPGGIPQMKGSQDYLKQMIAMRDWIKRLSGVPCDFVLTGHLAYTEDASSGRLKATMLITGKLAERMPVLFNEVYVATTKQTSKGIEYSLLTQNDGAYRAKTALGKGGLFGIYETPDIKALLKKAGKPVEDKPLFTD